MAGSIFENYVISEIIKKETHSKSLVDFYYYRTARGEEVDLIIDQKIKKSVIEIKFNATFHPRMIKHINTLLTKGDQGYLLYNGKKLPYKKNIQIMNYKDFLCGINDTL
jgi:predicted AAA+ superfamily ATPase